MNQASTLSIYANIVEITHQMLMASKAKDWDSLEKLENTCAQEVDKIRALKPQVPLTEEERNAKISYIETILATDRAIRDEVEPWMTQLSRMMNSSTKKQQLNQAYGGNNTQH